MSFIQQPYPLYLVTEWANADDHRPSVDLVIGWQMWSDEYRAVVAGTSGTAKAIDPKVGVVYHFFADLDDAREFANLIGPSS